MDAVVQTYRADGVRGLQRGVSLGQSRSAKQSVTQRFSAQRARAPHSLLYWHCTRAHAASSANATQSTTTPRSLMGGLYRAGRGAAVVTREVNSGIAGG